MIAPDLERALRESQRLGFLGERPIEQVVAHARGFVAELDGVSGPVLDLGTGGGVPGLVIAAERPDLHVTLLDRRMKRTDFLQRVVGRLGWGDRVRVVHGDAEWMAAEAPASFSAVVARGFGPPADTLRAAVRLVAAGGRIVVSEPPSGDRWPAQLLDEVGVVRRPAGVRPAGVRMAGVRMASFERVV